MELPKIQRVLKVKGPGVVAVEEYCPLPVVEEDEILVRVRCVSINPVDVKMLDLAPHIGATAGCEFSGTVIEVGGGVRNRRLIAGVAVFGCVCGNHPVRGDNGAFAEYVAIAGDLVYILPAHFSFEEGASLAVPIPTVGMALYSQWPLQLPRRPDPGSLVEKEIHSHSGNDVQYLLVYGGSTVCGAMAVQMARMSGLKVICTCSPRNFAMVKELGAEEAFDYNSSSCGSKIREYTANKLGFALDCITDVSSMRTCYAAIGSAGGRYMGLNPIPIRAHSRRDIKASYVLLYTIFGKEMNLPSPYGRPARPKDRKFAETWYQGTQSLVDTPGALRPHPLQKAPVNGLDGVIEGLVKIRNGEVRGSKLVYCIA